MKKSILKIICACLALVMVGVVMSGCKKKDKEDGRGLYDYRYDYVIALLTEEAGFGDQTYMLRDFPEVEAEGCIRFVRTTSRTLTFQFAQENKERGERVIALLKERPDIENAYFPLRNPIYSVGI